MVAIWGRRFRVWNGDDVKLIYSKPPGRRTYTTIRGLQVPGLADWRRGAHDVAERRLGAGAYPPERGDAVVSGQTRRTGWRNRFTTVWRACGCGRRGQQEPSIPNHYGVDDFPVIIQDVGWITSARRNIGEPGSGGFVGDTLLVNGWRAEPVWAEVSRGWVRLRLLNASNSRRYQLQMSDGRLLYVISGDQGFLPAPVSLKQHAGPGGKWREILVDMTNGDEVSITCGERRASSTVSAVF